MKQREQLDVQKTTKNKNEKGKALLAKKQKRDKRKKARVLLEVDDDAEKIDDICSQLDQSITMSEFDEDEDLEDAKTHYLIDVPRIDPEPEDAIEEPELEIEPPSFDRTMSSSDSSLTMDNIDVQSVSSEDVAVLQRPKKKLKRKKAAIN